MVVFKEIDTSKTEAELEDGVLKITTIKKVINDVVESKPEGDDNEGEE